MRRPNNTKQIPDRIADTLPRVRAAAAGDIGDAAPLAGKQLKMKHFLQALYRAPFFSQLTKYGSQSGAGVTSRKLRTERIAIVFRAKKLSLLMRFSPRLERRLTLDPIAAFACARAPTLTWPPAVDSNGLVRPMRRG
jgi:hypothetical protein